MGNCTSGEQRPESESVLVVAGGVSLPVRTQRRFGWKKDLPDYRDKVLAFLRTRGLPRTCDLRKGVQFPPVYDQGDLGSCTANAIAAAIHFCQIKEKIADWEGSRLFIYYNERACENTIDEDSGASMRDGCIVCAKLGVCPETMWPYIPDKFTERPSSGCYTEALKYCVKEYARIPQTSEDFKCCLNNGFPFVFGFIVCSSFMTEEVAATGKMTMPQPTDYVMGGHAVMCVGYDDDTQCFIIRNSWGASWGCEGYFFMPYQYMCHEQLAQDFWCIRVVDGVDFPCKRS